MTRLVDSGRAIYPVIRAFRQMDGSSSGADVSRVDADLEELMKGVYLLVLGLGFTFVVRDLLASLGTPVRAAAELLYFLALYYFLTYDWIAYCALIASFPTRSAGTRRSASRVASTRT